MTTTVASSSHETITPQIWSSTRIRHPETVAGLLTVASACIPSFPYAPGCRADLLHVRALHLTGGAIRSDLFQRSKTSPRPYLWLRRLSMLAVLSASEGVGVVFFYRSCSYGPVESGDLFSKFLPHGHSWRLRQSPRHRRRLRGRSVGRCCRTNDGRGARAQTSAGAQNTCGRPNHQFAT